MLDVFDIFYALSNGPVESDIYNYITSGELTYYTYKDFSFNTKLQYGEVCFSDELKERIKSSIEALKQKKR